MNRKERQLVTLEDVIDFLNELVKIDADALRALIIHRVDCNEELALHPTVQVSGWPGDGYAVGMLGILNGLFGATEDGIGFLTAVFQDGELVKFQKSIVDLYRLEAEHEAD